MPSEFPSRVIRGGGWYNGSASAQAAYSLRFATGFRLDRLGVRLIRILGVLEQLAEAKDAK